VWTDCQTVYPNAQTQAAERKVGCGPGCLVDENHASLDLAGDTLPSFDIFGNHRSPQPVRRVVSKIDRLFFIFILRAVDQRNRAKNST
jgi:hypothetical protein